MSWKLAVAEYLPPFDISQQHTTTLDAAVTAAASTFYLSSAADFFYVRQGDILLLGPSTHADNPGVTEYVRVKTTSQNTGSGNTTIGLDTASVQYAYSSGDPVQAVGSGVPQGWQIDWPATGDSVIAFMGNNPRFYEASNLFASGFYSPTGMWIYKNAGTTGWHYMSYYLNGPLLNNVYYRLGIYVNSIDTFGGTTGPCLFRVWNGDDAAPKIETIGNAFTNGWTKFENVDQWNVSTTYDDFTRDKIYLAWDYTLACPLMGFDCPYLTHASLTDSASSGCYTIPTNPTGGIQIEYSDRSSRISMGDNMFLSHTPATYETPKTVRLRWDDVSPTVLRNLEILQWWNARGNYLLLEQDTPGVYNAHLDLQRPLIGNMEFTISYEAWDTDLITVDMTFTGR